MIEQAWLIPLFPVISFLIILLFGNRMKEGGGYVAVAFVGLSMLVSLLTIRDVFSVGRYESEGISWLGSEAFRFGILIDPLSAVMLFVVSFVGFLIVVYSLGYMEGDPGFARYYAFMSLFTASMVGLVISANLLQLFVYRQLRGWGRNRGSNTTRTIVRLVDEMAGDLARLTKPLHWEPG